MAKTALNTLKSWFENGDYPNQEQFWSWMDSFWHKDEGIPMEVIQGLENLLNGKATTQDIENVNLRIDQLENLPSSAITERITQNGDLDYTVPEGQLLEKIVVVPADNIEMSIGTTEGGQEIAPVQTLVGGIPSVMVIDWYALAETHIYITGITEETELIIFKRQ